MPQRSSLRIKGIASDGTSVADELRNGQIVLKNSKESSVWGPFPRYQDAPEPKPREMPTGNPVVLTVLYTAHQVLSMVIAPRKHARTICALHVLLREAFWVAP